MAGFQYQIQEESEIESTSSMSYFIDRTMMVIRVWIFYTQTDFKSRSKQKVDLFTMLYSKPIDSADG